MDVRLLFLMNCAIVVNCQSTVSNSNDVSCGEYHEMFEIIKSEMGSIRQLLMNLQQTPVRSETHAIQEIKSNIEEMSQILLKQHTSSNDSQVLPRIKSEIGEIRQIILKQDDTQTQTTQEIRSKVDEIRQIMLGLHGNETQATREIKSKVEEIRTVVVQQPNGPRKGLVCFKYLTVA